MFNSDDTIISLAVHGPAVLACGAWLKNTICLTQDNTAYISPLIGDLSTAEHRHQLDETVRNMCQKYSVSPRVIAHDLHPDFYSTRFAKAYAEQYDVPIVAVQHHHAHIGAICAEHQLDQQPVLGLALDGVGLGTNNMPWGGELLLVEGARFRRLGHLATLAMPGGDRAAQEPWRMAAAVLAKLNRSDEITQRFANQPAAETVASMLEKNLNCPYTSSMGRLFDAAAGLLGVNFLQAHEAQAAMQLQQLAEHYGSATELIERYEITGDNNLDFSPLLSFLIDCYDTKYDVAHAAAIFHATVIEGLAAWAEKIANEQHIFRLAFGGGCFHNSLLRHGLVRRLSHSSIQLFGSCQLQPDDSAIALGQAWIAMQDNSL